MSRLPNTNLHINNPSGEDQNLISQGIAAYNADSLLKNNYTVTKQFLKSNIILSIKNGITYKKQFDSVRLNYKECKEEAKLSDTETNIETDINGHNKEIYKTTYYLTDSQFEGNNNVSNITYTIKEGRPSDEELNTKINGVSWVDLIGDINSESSIYKQKTISSEDFEFPSFFHNIYICTTPNGNMINTFKYNYDKPVLEFSDSYNDSSNAVCVMSNYISGTGTKLIGNGYVKVDDAIKVDDGEYIYFNKLLAFANDGQTQSVGDGGVSYYFFDLASFHKIALKGKELGDRDYNRGEINEFCNCVDEFISSGSSEYFLSKNRNERFGRYTNIIPISFSSFNNVISQSDFLDEFTIDNTTLLDSVTDDALTDYFVNLEYSNKDTEFIDIKDYYSKFLNGSGVTGDTTETDNCYFLKEGIGIIAFDKEKFKNGIKLIRVYYPMDTKITAKKDGKDVCGYEWKERIIPGNIVYDAFLKLYRVNSEGVRTHIYYIRFSPRSFNGVAFR